MAPKRVVGRPRRLQGGAGQAERPPYILDTDLLAQNFERFRPSGHLRIHHDQNYHYSSSRGRDANGRQRVCRRQGMLRERRLEGEFNGVR